MVSQRWSHIEKTDGHRDGKAWWCPGAADSLAGFMKNTGCVITNSEAAPGHWCWDPSLEMGLGGRAFTA